MQFWFGLAKDIIKNANSKNTDVILDDGDVNSLTIFYKFDRNWWFKLGK